MGPRTSCHSRSNSGKNNNIIGGTNLKQMFEEGVAPLLAQGKHVCLRFTLDGIEMNRGVTVVNATFKWLNIGKFMHGYGNDIQTHNFRQPAFEVLGVACRISALQRIL